MQRNESASQRSGSLAALQWSGMETAGIGGVRLLPRRQSAILKRRQPEQQRSQSDAALKMGRGVALF